MKINNKEFDFKERTYIIGILNVTPDSFSDGGKYNSLDNAVAHALKMVGEGADIVEIGGESTRPNSEPVSLEKELQRVIPVIKAIRGVSDIPISVDTMKPAVAAAAISAGANMINDVSNLRYDKTLAEVCAKADIPFCLMHSRADMFNTDYEDLLPNLLSEMQTGIDIALAAGVKAQNLIVDPGIGFSKTAEQNLEILNRLEEFTKLPYPVMLGTSRKRFIRSTLDLPLDDIVEGTLATTAVGILKGCAFIRVHDVKENKRICLMTDSICRR